MANQTRYGVFRTQFEANKKKILLSQDVCGICGKPVDKTLKYPHPMCATVDHIIPLDRGGHPSDMDNLQLAHFTCNRTKWNKLPSELKIKKESDVVNNRNLPHIIDWMRYKAIETQ